MRGWLPIGLVAVLLLAGCAQKGDPSSSSTGATTTGSATTGAALAPNQTNQPPTATLALAGNATAGLNATFVLGGSDPDGDALNWTLSFGDGSANQTGAALPANVTHAFAAGGNFTVTLTVSDGEATATRSLNVSLAAPAGSGFTPVDETKPWTVSRGGAYEYALGCVADGEDCAYFDLPAGASGRAYTLTIEATVPSIVYFLDYYKGDDFEETITGEPAGHEFTGTVPDGITQFRVYAAGGAMFSAHLVVE